MFDNLINGIKNGFRVANATRRVVFNDKQLFLYPVIAVIIAAIAAVIILGSVLGFLVIGHLQNLNRTVIIISLVIAFIFLYFVVFFTSTYLTMAMLIAFREYTNGKRISISEALGRTSQYAKLILEWAIFYTIVATLIHIIEGAIRGALSRYGFSGNIISSMITGGLNLGFAIAVAFSLPVILDEKKGPIETIKLSTSFIMKNFGDTFGGLLFSEIFQIVFVLMGLGLIFIGILPYLLGAGASSGLVAVSIVLVVLGVLSIIVGSLLRYVLFNCFKLIVYDYKTKKKLPKGFDAKLIDGSIKKRNKPSNKRPFGVLPVELGSQQGNI